ncbi:MAG: APC family permease [Anaerolineae bacterium]|nr:APC family permease [Anaerolineae bacterium]
MLRHQIRRLIIGSPLPSAEAAEKRLDKIRALAALSPDALASVAYANQEIFLGLAVAGAAGLAYSWAIALVITGLLAILTLSYSQTIQAYPAGGGSYTVARENLGETIGLVAAAALLIDYVLNAAVSLTAGVEALASAFPSLWPYRTGLSLTLLVLITLVNLRGMQETGTVMALPVYFFLITYLGMIAYGIVVALVEGPGSLQAHAPPAFETITLVLLLRTFAAGATALTGVEAISNAVPVFKPPESRHARQTMMAMAVLMGVLFLGTIGLIRFLAITTGAEETILSALSRRLFGSGIVYYLVQMATLGVLIVAANTSFTGFPRVTSIMAHDSFVPRQLKMLGDRLVFSNGIILLSSLAGFLIVVFRGDSHHLIPLFAVGAFLAFSLSQTGMVAHWIHERGPHWRVHAAINGVGAVATSAALVIIGSSKFTHGAWIVMLLIPLFVFGFRRIRAHYEEVAEELTLAGQSLSFVIDSPPRIVVPVAGVHRGVVEALQYARSISPQVTAVYIEIDPDSAANMEEKWRQYGLYDLAPLVILTSPYRSFIGPFLAYLDQMDAEGGDGQLASVVIPEFVPAKWWHNSLHNQTAWLLKITLLYRRYRLGKSRAIIDVPFHLRH